MKKYEADGGKLLICVFVVFFGIASVWMVLEKHFPKLHPKYYREYRHHYLSFEMDLWGPEWDNAQQHAHDKEVDRARERCDEGRGTEKDQEMVTRDYFDKMS